MKIISTAWISGAFSDFEAQSCLRSHAEVGLSSSAMPLLILILDGYDKIPSVALDSYSDKNIIFKDCSKPTKTVISQYSELRAKTAEPGNLYEFYCFIRWLVVNEFLHGEPFLHIDLDLFFQSRYEEVTKAFDGRTGTFGSPCLTAVTDYNWLATYEDALKQLAVDPLGVQARLGYAGNEFRSNIFSDQDLITALERASALPRDSLGDLRESYSVFINPLWPYHTRVNDPCKFSVKDGKDTMNGKEVLFWHLQNNFSDYLSRYATLMSLKDYCNVGKFLPVRLNNPFLQLLPTAENFAFFAIRDLMRHMQGEYSADLSRMQILQFYQRTWVSNWFIVLKQGRGLFSEPYWWEENVFAKDVS